MVKICVYTIAKNEALHVARWVESAKDADLLFVADTGSTDDTVKLLKQHNVQTSSIKIEPFRFDKARQAALDSIPNYIDICVSLDMDEVLVPNWRQKLLNAWQSQPDTNRLFYKYIWAFDEFGKPKNEFLCEKIHARHSHKWIHPVHEIITPLEHEIFSTCQEVLIEHHPDSKKSRNQYLPLLEIAVKETPMNDRNSYYLGREYFFYQLYDKSIAELKRHLSLPTATWKPERAASMRYIAKNYWAQQNVSEAEKWFSFAVLEDEHSKESLIDLASFYLAYNKYFGAIHFATKAIDVPNSAHYVNEAYAQNEGANEIISVASYYLGQYDTALIHVEKALNQNPNNMRLHDTKQFIMKALEGKAYA